MDSVIKQTGSCGCFQVSLMIYIQCIRIVNVCCIYLMVFGNYEPPWKCVRNGTHPYGINNTTSIKLDALQMQNIRYGNRSLSEPQNNIEVHSGTINNDTSISPQPANSSLLDAMGVSHQGTCDQLSQCDEIVFEPRTVTLVSQFGLICDKAFIPSCIIAVQMLGTLLGNIVVGQVAESFGRKRAIYGCTAIMSLATFISAWSTSWQMYAGLTFIIGLASGGILSSFVVYVMEFLSPKWRGLIWSIPTWNLGLLVFACTVVILKVWWQVHIVCGCMGGLFLLGVFWVPESLRWLQTRGEDEKCKKVIEKMIKCNKRTENASDLLQTLNEGTDNNKRDTYRKYGYVDLFRSSKLRKLTIKVSFLWFTTNLCYFTLGFSVKALSGDYYINLALSSIIEVPFIVCQAFIINKMGRTFTACLSVILSTVFILACLVSFYAIDDEELSGSLIKYLALLAKGCALSGWTSVAILTSELYPTVVRSLALGFFNAVARCGGIVATMLIPRDQQSVGICFTALSASLVISCVIILTIPDTAGSHLVDDIDMDVDDRCQDL